jgi:hypothetical protein
MDRPADETKEDVACVGSQRLLLWISELIFIRDYFTRLDDPARNRRLAALCDEISEVYHDDRDWGIIREKVRTYIKTQQTTISGPDSGPVK